MNFKRTFAQPDEESEPMVATVYGESVKVVLASSDDVAGRRAQIKIDAEPEEALRALLKKRRE